MAMFDSAEEEDEEFYTTDGEEDVFLRDAETDVFDFGSSLRELFLSDEEDDEFHTPVGTDDDDAYHTPTGSPPKDDMVSAPAEVVGSLPTRIHTNEEDDSTCSICRSQYQAGDNIMTLPCNHSFHTICLDPWLKNHNKVYPNCREDVCQAREEPSDED